MRGLTLAIYRTGINDHETNTTQTKIYNLVLVKFTMSIQLPTCVHICATQRTLSNKCTTSNFDFISRGFRQTRNPQYSGTCVHFDSGEVLVGSITSKIHDVAKKNSMSIFFRYGRPVNLQEVGTTIVSIHRWNITRN